MLMGELDRAEAAADADDNAEDRHSPVKALRTNQPPEAYLVDL